MTEWQPYDNAPKTGEWFIAARWSRIGLQWDMGLCRWSGNSFVNQRYYETKFTHWVPMPEPPKEK